MGRHRIRYERRYGDEKRDLQRWESVASYVLYMKRATVRREIYR